LKPYPSFYLVLHRGKKLEETFPPPTLFTLFHPLLILPWIPSG